jgi:hypothetical protein
MTDWQYRRFVIRKEDTIGLESHDPGEDIEDWIPDRLLRKYRVSVKASHADS